MNSSGVRLRISLLVAIAIVIANIYLVLNGSSNGFYASLSKEQVLDTHQATTQVAQQSTSGQSTSGRTSRDTFAAFETRASKQPGVY